MYTNAVSVTKSDTVNIEASGAPVAALYIGGAGDVAWVGRGGTVVVFKAVPVGTILPIETVRVNSTNTTATLILGLSQ